MPRRNVGGLDRFLRVGSGAVLLPTGLVLLAGGHPFAWAATILGALLVATGVLGFCPPYVLLGITTATPPLTRGRPGPDEDRTDG